MSPPAYKASLAQSPLPEVLSRIAHYGVPGTVHCSSDGRTVTILTEGGDIVFASPTEDAVSFLIEVLTAAGVSEKELEKARHEFEASGRSIGATLIARGLTTPVEMLPKVRNSVDRVLAQAFEWSEGTVEFRPGRTSTPIRLAIPIRRQILDAVRHVRNLKPLLARIGNRGTILEQAGLEPAIDLQKDEGALLIACDGRRSLENLVSLPPLSPGENGRILYGLFAIGLIRPRSTQLKVKVKA